MSYANLEEYMSLLQFLKTITPVSYKVQNSSSTIRAWMCATLLVKKLLMSADVKLEHCHTTKLVADMFKKPLGHQKCLQLWTLTPWMASLAIGGDN